MNNKIPPPIVTLVFGLAIYFSKPLFPDFSNVILNVLSLLLIIVGPLTLISAARSFKVQETTINPINIDKATSLVVSGVFKYSRNPMYLGMVLILLSISFKFNLIGGIILTMLFAGYITKFQIIPEEIVMNKLFGDEFEKYKKQINSLYSKALPHLEKCLEIDSNNLSIVTALKEIYYKLDMAKKSVEMKKLQDSLTQEN